MTNLVTGGAMTQTSQEIANAAEIKRRSAELATCGSLEMGAHRPEDAVRIAELLPTGTRVYVNHLPRHSLDVTLNSSIAVSRAGLEAVPHMAVRRIGSRAEAKSFLERAVKEAGVSKVLLLGGDLDPPAGPYEDAAALLSEGLLRDAGIREVALAAYPEGHPRIPNDVLWSALSEKIGMARAQGIGPYVVSQFTFAPSRIIDMCVKLARLHPDVPVYVGLPGPTSPAKLIKFAQVCGVSASLRAMTAQGMGAVRLFTNTDPVDQLHAVAQHLDGGATSNVVGIHMFTFGGIESAARWINKQIATE